MITKHLLTYFLFIFQFQDFRFLCPNDTVFDQQNLVCTNWFEVDCHQSVSFFFQGVGVKTTPSKQQGQNNQRPKEPESYDYNYEYTYFYEDDYNGDSNQGNNRFLANSTPSPTSGNSGVGGGRGNSGFQGNNNNIEQQDQQRPRPPLSHTTTAIPISVTTTRRPPRVKSNIFANGNNHNKPFFVFPSLITAVWDHSEPSC